MSDESTGTGSKGSDRPASLAQLAAATLPAAAQIGWQFGADGGAAVVEAPAEPPKRIATRGTLRSDARRAAEYLASRGKTPLESLHDVARMRWRVAVRVIAKELQCSKLEAFKIWQSCAVSLLPYSAARFDTIELGGQLAGSAGSLTVAHFLAASMVAERLGQPMSPEGRSFDSTMTTQYQLLADDGQASAQSGLPPKPAD